MNLAAKTPKARKTMRSYLMLRAVIILSAVLEFGLKVEQSLVEKTE
jgi:hypothetical protein